MAETLGYIPATIIAGETIWISAANTTQTDRNVDIILTDYTPANYALYYDFAADTPITVTAVANGSNTGWTLTVTAAQTALWKAGLMHYVGRVVKTTGGMVFAVDSGSIKVSASASATSDYKTAMDTIDVVILDYAANPMGSFTLGDMTVSYGSLDDLIKLRNHYKTLWERETSRRPKRVILSRFPV